MRIPACAALLFLSAPVHSEEVSHPFRGGKSDRELLKFTGGAKNDLVTPAEEGLRVRFTPGKVAKNPAGVYWRFAVRGDFVTTAEYEILQADRPKTGYGVGVEMYVALVSPTKDGIAFSRLLRSKEGPVVKFTHHTTNKDGERSGKSRQFPTTVRSEKGRLRLAREGTTLIASIAEADAEFQELYRTEIEPADLREIRVAGYGGGDPNVNLDLRLLDFQLKGDRLDYDGIPPSSLKAVAPAGASGGEAGAVPHQGNQRGFLVATILLLTLVPFALFVSLLFWHRLHKAKANDTSRKPPGEQEEKESPSRRD